MKNGRPGDLIVIFYENLDETLEVIKKMNFLKNKKAKNTSNKKAVGQFR
mgnify:CR=1 FL=1